VKAAVLLPVIDANQPMLFVHPPHRKSGAAQRQVSFPGGRSETGDLTPVETALRETFEETGIAPAFVTVAGYRPLPHGTGFDIQPVSAAADGFVLAPDPREVANVFEVPLAFLCDPATGGANPRDRGTSAQLLCFHL